MGGGACVLLLPDESIEQLDLPLKTVSYIRIQHITHLVRIHDEVHHIEHILHHVRCPYSGPYRASMNVSGTPPYKLYDTHVLAQL